jgi:glycosyltransferase involved in cell wall biosynthesis
MPDQAQDDKRLQLKVIQTIAGVRADHGGTSRSVPALCDAVAAQGVDVRLLAGRPADTSIRLRVPADESRVHLVTESRWIRQWGVATGFQQQLDRWCRESENCLTHDHGAWLPTNHAVASFARRSAVVRVVSPRGMLAPWSMNHGRWKKRLAWHAFQRRDLASATAFHATSLAEAQDIRALGFRQPIAVIPNGVCFPDDIVPKELKDGNRTMLFLSRIHPKKGLLTLLQAWKCASLDDSWRLVIAGPDEGGHRAVVERAARRLGLATQVLFTGEISDDDKWPWYSSADVFVLPSLSENFGIVVAESLAAGTPVITTTGTPWQDLGEIGCGWQVEPTVDALYSAIRHATSLAQDDLAAMGMRGASWVREKFAWNRVACEMITFYRWLLEGGNRPACIHE